MKKIISYQNTWLSEMVNNNRKRKLRGTVYLIHFEKPIKHASHYIGFTSKDDINERFEHHKKGQGSRLLRAANNLGIDYKIVRVWNNVDRNFERWLKNKKNSPRLCPICNKNVKGELYEDKNN